MNIQVLSEAQKRGHEQVVYFNYPRAGLKAIIGIHNTVLGPALGGCRMRLYEDESKALDDVLRLSEGMTYKSSLAGLDLGGGKACLIADPSMTSGRRELFLQFGHCLNHLSGRYITAEDMGTNVSDVTIMREVTRFAAGYPREEGGGGDPSPWTARGVFQAILAACERRYGTKDLKAKHVTVQGVGHVGAYLIEHLKEAGARVTICDTVEERVRKVGERTQAEIVSPEKIYDVQCDVYAPCAIGQTVNAQTIPRLKCEIIAGGANNQLSDPSVYKMLTEKNIMYCPDFLINAGGIMCVGSEYIEGGSNQAWLTKKVDAIYNTLNRVLDESQKRGKFPEVVAVEIAKERIRAVEEKKIQEQK